MKSWKLIDFFRISDRKNISKQNTYLLNLKLAVISNPDILIRITSGTGWPKPEAKKCLRIIFNLNRTRKRTAR